MAPSLFGGMLLFAIGSVVAAMSDSIYGVIAGRAIQGSGAIAAAVMALAADALGAENVRAVLMPSTFSSDHSVNDAVALAENLGSPYDIIPIETAYDAFVSTLKTQFEGTPFNVAEENIQARTRGLLLMAFSNKFLASI